MNESSIFPYQWDNVGDRPERNEIEFRFKIEIGYRASLQERVAKFEYNAYAAQIVKWRIRIDLGIHYRDALGQSRFRLVMIEHDHIDPAPLKIRSLGHGRCAAINRDQELGPMLLDTTFNALAAQAVTFFHAQRQKKLWSGSCRTVRAQHFRQKRERRYAIDIVISEKKHSFVSIQRVQNARHRFIHLRQQKRIGQGFQTRSQKIFNLPAAGESFA